MPRPWKDVAASEEYQALPSEEQAAAQQQYFETVVAPKVPPPDRGKAWSQFLSAYPSTSMTERGKAYGEIRQDQPQWKKNVSAFVRPVLEGGGAAAGGIVGVGAGVGVASPILGAAGGALGYAAGRRGANIVDEALGLRKPVEPLDIAKETAEDLGTGAMYEMGGQAAVPLFGALLRGGKWVFNSATEPVKKALSVEAQKQGAADILRASTSAGDIYAKNAAEAAELESAIPGLKFTMGQQTNDPALIKLERTQMRSPGSGATRNAEQLAQNNEALRAYYEKTFPEGELDDLLKELRGQRETVEQGQEAAQAVSRAEAAKLPAKDPTDSGQAMVDTLTENKGAVKKQAGKLYDAVPPMEIPVQGMLDEFTAIAEPMSKFEEPGNIPDLLGVVRKSFKPAKPEASKILTEAGTPFPATAEELPKSLSLEDLQGLRSEFLARSRQARASQVPNERLASRLDRAAKAVEKAIQDAEGADEAGQALAEANRFFREDYSQVFRQGTVGDILRKGPRGEPTRAPLGQIPDKVWNTRNLSAADDFIRATDKASDIMRDHAAYDLLKKATDDQGNIVPAKLKGWMTRNRALLDRFGIAVDFEGVANAQKAVEIANEAAKGFEKSVAARLLNADPERAVASALGGKDAGMEARKLLASVRGNNAAVKGLQKAFADHFLKSVETTAKDIASQPVISSAQFTKLMEKARPVMNVLYSPEQVFALDKIHRAYEIAARNTRSPVGGGSDTAENMLTELAKVNLLSRTASAVKAVYRLLNKYGDNAVNEFVNRALFDPDYAKVLLDAANGKIPAEKIEIAMGNKIVNLNAYRRQRLQQAAAGAAATVGGVTYGSDQRETP